MIFSAVADPRLVMIRRGGTLSDDDHRLLAIWAAACADHVLGIFEEACPADPRPRLAVLGIRAWARGETSMTESRAAGGHAMAAARPLTGAPRFAAYAAGQAACVGHVAAHNLGASAYAIKAVRFASGDAAARFEREWQRRQLPSAISALVISDQASRDDPCWSMFTF